MSYRPRDKTKILAGSYNDMFTGKQLTNLGQVFFFVILIHEIYFLLHRFNK